MATASWGDLPQGVVQLLVDLLRWPEISSLCLVNRHWKVAVRFAVRTLRPSHPYPELVDIYPNLENLDFGGCWDAVEDVKVVRIARKLARTKTLRSLNLSKCHAVTNRGIAEVANSLSDLETLILTGCREPFPAQGRVGRLGYVGVNGSTLVGLKKLKHLDLQWNPVNDQSVPILTELTSLTRLVLGESGISNKGVILLQSLPNLQVLSLDRTMVSECGLCGLMGMENLRKLSLKTCSRVGDEELLCLAKFPSLEILNLSKCDITDAGVAALSDLPCLKELDISHCLRISGECFDAFQDSTSLRTLKLQDCCACGMDSTLRILSGIAPLRELDLKDCTEVSDAGIGYLVALPLETLNLSRCCKISGQGLAMVSNITSLTSLDISFWSELVDHWLDGFSRLTNLRVLNLDSCRRISDEGIRLLKPLGKSLKHLSCSYCRELTSESIHFLAENFPELTCLELAWLSIEDSDCTLLRKLPKLSKINVRGCPSLTIAGMRELWYVDGAFDSVKTPQQRMQ